MAVEHKLRANAVEIERLNLALSNKAKSPDARRASALSTPLSPRSDDLPGDLTEERLRKYVVRVVRTVSPTQIGPITPGQLFATLDTISKLIGDSKNYERVIRALGLTSDTPSDQVVSKARQVKNPLEDNLALFCTLFDVKSADEIGPAMRSLYARTTEWQEAAKVMERALGLRQDSMPSDIANAVVRSKHSL